MSKHIVYGGDLTRNRQALVERMVVVEGGHVVIRPPISASHPDQRVLRLPGGVETCAGLREMVYQLLTAIAYDVQDRFHVRRRSDTHFGTGEGQAYDPDTVIGPDLAKDIQTAAARDSKSR